VNLQISFTTHLTHALLPTLISNQAGLIINIIGLTGRFPYPHLAIHFGKKAYLAGFSRALAIELEILRDPPVDIECLVELEQWRSRFFVPTGETMGKAIIGVVGCGHRSVTAYWRAEIISYILGCLPLSWMDSILAKEMKATKIREVELEMNRKNV
jgi:17beta-estradiol 17-dehydrogenase / very-long-chain 3-oxoacyl-CoA reductase